MKRQRPRDELIFFKQPPACCRLMVYDLDVKTKRDELLSIFSSFGAISSLDLRGDVAFVNYAAASSASEAMSELGTEHLARPNQAAPSLSGRKLKLKKRTREVSFNPKFGDWLLPHETVQLANSVFGFNGWSSTVVELQQLVNAREADARGGQFIYRETDKAIARDKPDVSGLYRSHWFCIVEVTVHSFNVKVTGQAYGLAGDRDWSSVLGIAKKVRRKCDSIVVKFFKLRRCVTGS